MTEFYYYSLMKAADISNEARPFNVSKMWADALMKEYLSYFSIPPSSPFPCFHSPVSLFFLLY